MKNRVRQTGRIPVWPATHPGESRCRDVRGALWGGRESAAQLAADYNQSLRLNVRYRPTAMTAMRKSAQRYPYRHWSSGMVSKFMP